MEYKLYQKIKSIRAFNRYYTNILGLVNKNILDYNFSLAEARVLIGNFKDRKLYIEKIVRFIKYGCWLFKQNN